MHHWTSIRDSYSSTYLRNFPTIYYLQTALYIWKFFFFFLILLLFLKYFLRMCTWWDALFCSQYFEDMSHCPQASFVTVEKLLESQGLNNGWSFLKIAYFFSTANSKAPCYLWYPDEASHQYYTQSFFLWDKYTWIIWKYPNRTLVVWRLKTSHLKIYVVIQSLSRVWLFVTPCSASTAGFPVLHHLPELAQTHVLSVGDAIQPSYLLSSPSLPAFNLSQHQGLSL